MTCAQGTNTHLNGRATYANAHPRLPPNVVTIVVDKRIPIGSGGS
jgi:hypothetical protein